jgi:D-glycero-D-manno-heptose 1,7-bisphosphate phosphatase
MSWIGEPILKGLPQRRPQSLNLRQTVDALQRKIACAHGSRPGVIVDRDGTINLERGYLHDPAEVKLLPGSGEALALLNAADIPVVIITNQSGIGRGIITTAEFESVNQMIWDALQVHGAHYDGLYYCPHDPTVEPSCSCRKPRAGLLLQAAVDLRLDLSRSYDVGDKRSDIEAGKAVGNHTVLVLTGFGLLARQELESSGVQADYIADDLLDACRWILYTQAPSSKTVRDPDAPCPIKTTETSE